MCILFIYVLRGVAEQSHVKVALILDIPHACCRYPRVEVPIIKSPADKIFPNASFNHLVQDFIYFIDGPSCFAHGGQFLAIKLAFYRLVV